MYSNRKRAGPRTVKEHKYKQDTLGENFTLRSKQENQDENLFKKTLIPQELRDILKNPGNSYTTTTWKTTWTRTPEIILEIIKKAKRLILYTLKRVLYKYTSMILLRERRVTEQQFLPTDLSPTSLDKGTTDEETLQRFEK